MARTTSKPSLFSPKDEINLELFTRNVNAKVSVVEASINISSGFVESQPKFLVGIMHVTKDPWLSITIDGQLPAWEQTSYRNFSVLYFFGVSNSITTRVNAIIENLRWVRGRYASYGISYFLMFILRPWSKLLPKHVLVDENQSKIRATSLKVTVPELTATMRWKKLAFLNYFLEKSDAEYAIITTSSSLLNFEPIVEFLRNLKNVNQPIYAGRILKGHDCEFTSGSFTVMNRESARLILENRALIPVHVMDDIGFGTAFMKMGISPSSLESKDFESASDLRHFSKKTLETIAHFRFKSGPLHSRGDVAIMKELITKLRG